MWLTNEINISSTLVQLLHTSEVYMKILLLIYLIFQTPFSLPQTCHPRRHGSDSKGWGHKDHFCVFGTTKKLIFTVEFQRNNQFSWKFIGRWTFCFLPYILHFHCLTDVMTLVNHKLKWLFHLFLPDTSLWHISWRLLSSTFCTASPTTS